MFLSVVIKIIAVLKFQCWQSGPSFLNPKDWSLKNSFIFLFIYFFIDIQRVQK